MKAHTRRNLHLVGAALFTVQLPVALLTPLKTSVPYLVAISIYANIVGHLSGASAETPTED